MEMTITVPFENSRVAEIVYNSLRVDPEPPRSGMKKVMKVQDKDLIVNFSCQETRTMRVSVNSFFDLLSLVVQTVDKFDVNEEN